MSGVCISEGKKSKKNKLNWSFFVLHWFRRFCPCWVMFVRLYCSFPSFSIYFSSSLSLCLFSTTVSVLSLHTHCIITPLLSSQSGSQSSINQEAAEPTLLAGSPVVQALTAPSINSHADSVDTLLLSSHTTPSCTPLPLELHIDEDGCSAPTASAASTVVVTTSKFSQIQQKDDGVSVTSEISHVERLSVSATQNALSQLEVSSMQVSTSKVVASEVSSPPEKSASPLTVGKSPSPSSVVVSKSPSPVTMSKNGSPVLIAKSPSPSDLKFSNLSPFYKSPNPALTSQGPSAKEQSPLTETTEPKAVSPVPAPRLSSPVPKSSSPETVPKCSSPLSIPRLSSPVTIPHIVSSPTLPRHSSPLTVPKSPASLGRKAYTLPGASSPRASPISLGAVPPNSLSPPPTEKQAGERLDLTWPCREPQLDDALDKILAPNSPQLDENQAPGLVIPGDEDRCWEDEDGVYPDLSRDGTMTPMTESSWIDECFTPSTCPGTPDATLELPVQQPSAVERLSASGQVGGSTELFQNKLLAWILRYYLFTFDIMA